MRTEDVSRRFLAVSNAVRFLGRRDTGCYSQDPGCVLLGTGYRND